MSALSRTLPPAPTGNPNDGRDSATTLYREAARQPMLSREHEAELARRSLSGDAGAATELVASHLRFVIGIARGYRNYGLPMNDLVQEGVIGLMQAVRKFNPERNVRFATYAMYWIRAAIQEHVVRSWSLVRIGTTSAQKSLFFNLRRKMVAVMDSADAWSEDVLGPLARRFGMPLKEAVSLALRAARRDSSLDAEATGAGGESWLERLADPAPNPEEAAAEASETSFWNGLIARGIAMLPPREQVIIRERFLVEAAATREAIGRQLGISRERVRQLEAQALDTLRRIMLPARTGA